VSSQILIFLFPESTNLSEKSIAIYQRSVVIVFHLHPSIRAKCNRIGNWRTTKVWGEWYWGRFDFEPPFLGGFIFQQFLQRFGGKFQGSNQIWRGQ